MCTAHGHQIQIVEMGEWLVNCQLFEICFKSRLLKLQEEDFNMFAESKPPKFRESPNIFSTKYQLSCLLFAEKIDFLLVNQQKISQLKLKVNKIWLKRYLVITKYFGGSDPANML